MYFLFFFFFPRSSLQHVLVQAQAHTAREVGEVLEPVPHIIPPPAADQRKKKGCWGSPADHLTRYGEADPTSTPHTPALESALSHCGILGTPGAQ